MRYLKDDKLNVSKLRHDLAGILSPLRVGVENPEVAMEVQKLIYEKCLEIQAELRQLPDELTVTSMESL